MLERLEVRGLGIIDEVALELAPGFAVLTGETGAGKSLLVESMKLLAGSRASSDMVRTGDRRLRVEGWFAVPDAPAFGELLDDLGVDAADELVVRREVTQGGRSRCFANDVGVSAAALQRIAPFLLAIHGQHEQHGLADPGVQRRLIDDFAGHGELREQVRVTCEAWRSAAAERDRLTAAQAARRDRLDAIAFQLGEIDGAAPRPGEDEQLLARRQLLRHAVRLAELASTAVSRLTDGDDAAADRLAQAEREVAEMIDLGLPLAESVNRLAEARVHAEEVARELRVILDGVSQEPGELENLESRLHLLDQLMLKYGSPIDEVIAHRERLIEERTELESVADRVAAAEAAAGLAIADYDEAARTLDQSRRAAADDLLAQVQGVLGRLNMAGTRLDFAWRVRADEASPLQREGVAVAFDEDGVEECELRIAANPGEELRPMARIASGGELSRLHLALRTVLLGRRSAVGLTLLFDEVDSGLGGATAAALAELLRHLAEQDQVLVVTHLPQVAARADGHFCIEKVVVDGRAVTRTCRLDEAQREGELARMLAGGELSESARAHARALLGDA